LETIVPKRQLTLTQTSAIIIGQVIGSGIFINIPIVANITNNIWLAVMVWFLGGLLWLPQIFILAEMGTAYPEQGGPYYFINKAGSPFLAFVYTWTAFLTSDTPTLTIIGLLAADAISYFIPALSFSVYAKVFAAVLILSFSFLQYKSVKLGGSVQVVLTAAKLIPLFGVVFIGLFFLNSGNLEFESASLKIHSKNIWEIIPAGIGATVWAYAGFLNILYTSGEVVNPQKVLPKSLIGSIIFVMLAYVLISLFTSAIIPFDEILNTESGKFINPFMYIDSFKEIATGLFAVAVFISMLGVLNSSVITQPRLEYAMARDGLFFKKFANLHKEYLTPDFSIFAQSFFAIVLLVGDVNDLLGYFSLSYVLQNMLVYGSIFFLKKRQDYQPTYKSPIGCFMAVISILIQLYLAYGIIIAYPLSGLLACLFLIISALPFYHYFRKSNNRS